MHKIWLAYNIFLQLMFFFLKPPPKECWNGELKGYYVGYRPEGMNHPYTFKSIEASPNDTNEYLVTGLTKSARYSVLVKAYNKAGTGPPSQELVIRTLDGGKASKIVWTQLCIIAH